MLSLVQEVVNLWCLDDGAASTCIIKDKHELHLTTPDCTQNCPSSTDREHHGGHQTRIYNTGEVGTSHHTSYLLMHVVTNEICCATGYCNMPALCSLKMHIMLLHCRLRKAVI